MRKFPIDTAKVDNFFLIPQKLKKSLFDTLQTFIPYMTFYPSEALTVLTGT